MATPSWLAATAGYRTQPGQINQFLGAHSSLFVYTGAQVQSSQTTAGSGGISTNGLWLAQSFTTGSSQTAVGRADLNLSTTATTGAQLAPAVVGIYNNFGGAPSGSALVSTTVPVEYVVTFAGGYTPVPLPFSGLAKSTLYWLVVQAVGGSSFSYTWNKSNQTSGASTGPSGSTWTAQTYGLLYRVYDDTVSGLPQFMWDDTGSRWTYLGYTGTTITAINEYVVAQGTNNYLVSTRTLSYSNGRLVAGA